MCFIFFRMELNVFYIFFDQNTSLYIFFENSSRKSGCKTKYWPETCKIGMKSIVQQVTELTKN